MPTSTSINRAGNTRLRRRRLLIATIGTPLITACQRPQFFYFGWDEEVQLHDGRVIVVTVKYTYERLGVGFTFNPYEPSIMRATEFSFEPSSRIGRFRQIFQKHRIDLIEYLNGKWYLLLQRRGGLLTIERGGERKEVWGAIQNSSGHKCWSLDETGFTQASINDLPDPLLKINMLMDYAPVGELVALDGTRVTLAQKAEFKGKYPLNPSDQRIERPPLTVTKP